MAKKLDEKQLEWTRENIDFLASFTPKITIRALLQNIDIIDDELRHYRAESERLRQDERKMFKNAERYQDNIVKLSAEYRRLEVEVDEARESKKVPLPRLAVEEIEKIRVECDDGTHWKFKVLKLIYESSERALNLRRSTGVDQLLHALVNGYTIEEEPADPLQDGIRKLVNEWEAADRSFDLSVSVSDYIRSLRAESKN